MSDLIKIGDLVVRISSVCKCIHNSGPFKVVGFKNREWVCGDCGSFSSSWETLAIFENGSLPACFPVRALVKINPPSLESDTVTERELEEV